VSDSSQVRSAPGGCPEKATHVALEQDEMPTSRAELAIVLLPVDISLGVQGPLKRPRRRKLYWRRSGKK
jgi:hypothetical protein